MSKPRGPIWFYRDPKGWWQLKVLFLFFFANDWGFGFRVFDIGCNIWVRRVHANSFTTRNLVRTPIHFEFLPPSHMGHIYWRIKKWVNPGRTYIEP